MAFFQAVSRCYDYLLEDASQVIMKLYLSTKPWHGDCSSSAFVWTAALPFKTLGHFCTTHTWAPECKELYSLFSVGAFLVPHSLIPTTFDLEIAISFTRCSKCRVIMCYRLKICYNQAKRKKWLDTSFGIKSIVYHFLSIEKMYGISLLKAVLMSRESLLKLNSSCSSSQIFERNERQFIKRYIFLSISNLEWRSTLFPSCSCYSCKSLVNIIRFRHGFDIFVNKSIVWLQIESLI